MNDPQELEIILACFHQGSLLKAPKHGTEAHLIVVKLFVIPACFISRPRLSNSIRALVVID